MEESPYAGDILIINRAAGISHCLAQCLVGQGYQCTFVDSDSEANALLEHRRFDFTVFSDEYSVVVKRSCCSHQSFLYAS